MAHRFDIHDSRFDVTIHCNQPLQTSEPIVKRFLEQLAAWKSVVPNLKRADLKYVPGQQEYRLDYETTGSRDFETVIKVTGGLRVRPITDDFWTQAELGAYIPVVTLAGILIVRHAVERFDVVWL